MSQQHWVESSWQLSEIDNCNCKTWESDPHDRCSNRADKDPDQVVCSTGRTKFSVRSRPFPILRNKAGNPLRCNTILVAWRSKRSKLVE